jgi:hypothetical protein
MSTFGDLPGGSFGFRSLTVAALLRAIPALPPRERDDAITSTAVPKTLIKYGFHSVPFGISIKP